MADLSAIYRDDADTDEVIDADAYQELINTGQCWMMDGRTGRTAMRLLEDGYCVLGEVGHNDYYGNYVPARTEVEPGSKGSVEYAEKLTGFTVKTRCSECDGKGNAPDGNGIVACAFCDNGKVSKTVETTKMLTKDELRLDPEHFAIANKWLMRGDGIAVYENQEIGHPNMGDRQFVSYGSKAAQLETNDPPLRLPDIGNAINRGFDLVGVYRGELL